MSDSQFWRDLAKQFHALPVSWNVMRADRTSSRDEGRIGEWTLHGPPECKAGFEALARRAAMRLPERESADLLAAWLEALAKGSGARPDKEIMGTNVEGTKRVESVTKSYYKLPVISATYCQMLESAAIQTEFDNLSGHAVVLSSPGERRFQSVVATNLPRNKSAAEQIQELRDECRWSMEKLAEKTGFDVRTVRRHLSGEAQPRLNNLAIYETAFSKELKRKIVVKRNAL